jgi:hypothetical protein
MVGSKLKLEDFAYNEPEMTVSFSEDQMNTLINSLTGLQKTLESFNQNKTGKEGNSVAKKVIDDDLKNQKTAQFEDGDGEGGSSATTDPEANSEDGDEESGEEGGEGTGEEGSTEEGSGDEGGEGTEDNSSTNAGNAKKKTNNSIHREGVRDGMKYNVNFEISHEDIRYALYNLISSWDEEDNDWYLIDKVYDDKFVASGFWSNQIWGSKYAVDGDNVNLDGERYTLHAEYVTDDELASLNEMRANYSSLQEKVAKYELAELNAQRDEILNSEKYAEYADTEEFKALRENKEKYSLDELKTQCELAFAAQFDGAKPKKQNFAQEEPKSQPKKQPKMFGFLQREQVSNTFLEGLKNKSMK